MGDCVTELDKIVFWSAASVVEWTKEPCTCSTAETICEMFNSAER